MAHKQPPKIAKKFGKGPVDDGKPNTYQTHKAGVNKVVGAASRYLARAAESGGSHSKKPTKLGDGSRLGKDGKYHRRPESSFPRRKPGA